MNEINYINQNRNIKDNATTSYLFIKRAIDIIGALVGLIVLLPLFIIISILIKVSDGKNKANVIFGHKRVGLHGKLFNCWKFRSMVPNAEEMLKQLTPEQEKEYKETFKLKDDPRITNIGKFLRKTSLDELPQLWNILVGEMTIVGPRPIVTKELVKYGQYQEYYKSVKPGLTGYWQINGRSDTSYEERVQLDMEYIEKRNIGLDLYIILKTVVKIFKREGAY